VTDTIRRGEVFAPMHWTGETARCARIDSLVAPVTDPVSGQPESKAAAVSVTPFRAKWHGFAVSRNAPSPVADYWALSRSTAGFRLELAAAQVPQDWLVMASDLFGLEPGMAQHVADQSRGSHRFAFFDGDRLVAALFAGAEPLALARDWLAVQPGAPAPGILAGRAPQGMPDPGPVVCSCFSVGANTIIQAALEQHLTNVDEIGQALQAGTNCGSCRSELAALLGSFMTREAAE
jgi:assimilatory nitrate reductase catalytic subunit